MAHGGGGIQESYQDLLSDDEAPTVVVEPTDALLDDSQPFIVVPEIKTDRWNHVEDLDSFFKKVYNYHQKHGFMCMFLETVLRQLQFVFVIIFVTFLFSCVDYAILFKDKPVGGHNTTEHVKVKLKDAITPPGQCIAGVSGLVMWCLGIVLLFWLTKVIKEVFQLREYLHVKRFYTSAMHILPHELDNMTWHDVQQRLLKVQKEHEMCVHKKNLTELDVYHRILRHENYLVALVNKDVIPVKYNLPFFGNCVFLSSGLRYNLEAMLFWGPWAPFENSWHLKEEYRNGNRELHLADQLSKSMLYIGLFNLALLPLILIWQLLFIIFSYADVVKREPGFLGARMWSEYSRVHLRHFNELDHELNSRLCMGYRASARYMNSFTSHVTVVLCQNAVFFAGSFWVVLVGLTVWDEDFLAVEHIVTALAMLSMVLAICRAAIPDEHTVCFPEALMKTILHHIHYMPDHWRGMAHTASVRDEFSNLFTYKMTHLLSELLSPLVTPLIIIGPLRARSHQIVKFFCDNTVTIQGVGDVCSFAQMDVATHGDPEWTALAENGMTESEFPIEVPKPPPSKQAEMGKTELSLAHFHHTNPEWNPDGPENQRFLSGLGQSLASMQPQGETLSQSLYHMSALNPFLAVSLRPRTEDVPRGAGVTSAQGPITSYIEESFVASSIPGHPSWPPMVPPTTHELAAAQTSASAIFLHESRYNAMSRNHPSTNYGLEATRRPISRPAVLTSIHERRTETTPLLRRSMR